MNRLPTYTSPIIYTTLILFIITSLIYDHHQRGYRFTSRASNNSDLIEQALKRIPACNEYDPSRQRSLLYTLQTWNHLARSHHFRYWLGYRTLHGYLYHHDLSPDHHHIDIMMMAQDTPQLIDVMNANYSSDYKLKVHPQWFLSEGLDFKLRNARFINQKTNVSIDIWPVFADYSNAHRLMLAQYIDMNNWMLTPADWTFPLEPCVFSGIQVWCPTRAKRLIVSMYGQTLKSLSCVNGVWIHS